MQGDRFLSSKKQSMLKPDEPLAQTGVEKLSDEHLAGLARAGQKMALSQLVERYHAPLLGYLYRLVDGDRSLAEDLVQETFVRLLRQTSLSLAVHLNPGCMPLPQIWLAIIFVRLPPAGFNP